MNRTAEWVAANPERSRAIKAKYRASEHGKAKARAYYAANKERIRAQQAAAHAANPEPARQRTKAWVEANPERAAEGFRRYQQSNRAKVNRRNALRRKYHKLATPVWVDVDALRDAYLEAEYFQLEVDHIIPLRGKRVCGLHVPENLQLLSSEANRRKGNRFEVDHAS